MDTQRPFWRFVLLALFINPIEKTIRPNGREKQPMHGKISVFHVPVATRTFRRIRMPTTKKIRIEVFEVEENAGGIQENAGGIQGFHPAVALFVVFIPTNGGIFLFLQIV
jgi:hypothetical protein